ncbi:MAG: aspartate kinase [Planctomycetia bacterium]|nr:aspartate kinase [Planctomycetia bacterium]
MPLIVQKFGGTSVADSQKILAAARKAVRAQQEGNRVVMVVSAMGKNTDVLVDLAHEITDSPPAREMDMLLSTGEQVSVALMAMAIESLGCKAISFTGAQIGIRTDSTHTKARIHSISTDRMRKALDGGKIVIAAGFQGTDEDQNITTLGRGGSDTTAVALAAVLGADACEIFTDVDGVYTTDPRALPEARRVRQVSYDEMLELASLGAGVMHSRSIEFAKKFSVPIHVRSSFSDQPGTIITDRPEAQGQAVSGATLVKNEARVTVLGVPDKPGTSLALFSKIAAQNISVDMIVQNVGAEARADISFTVPRDELVATMQAVEAAAAELGAEDFSRDENVSKISVVGLGMATQTGVAQKMFRALSEAGVNIQMITTSEIKISVLVGRDQATAALRAVHRAFELEKEPGSAGGAVTAEPARAANANDIVARLRGNMVARLQGMEDLTIDDIALDETQARVTITGVPDVPGLAAEVFERIAAGNIFVDMIVQSLGRAGHANLSFTVPQAHLDRALAVSRETSARLGCGPVTSAPKVAKLSVSGIGMRSHTDVAIRMFRALAAEGINVAMINTSEVRVNVVVDGAAGPKGLECLTKAFADALV